MPPGGDRFEKLLYHVELSASFHHGVSFFKRFDGRRTISELKMNSVSGDMYVTGALGARGRIKAETMSGDVHVDLNGEVSASIDAETFSGDIRSDFGSVDREEHGPGERLRFKSGGGEGEIELKSFSGDLSVRKH